MWVLYKETDGFYVQPNKDRFRDIHPSQFLSMVLKKVNLTQQKQTCTKQIKDTVIWNKDY